MPQIVRRDRLHPGRAHRPGEPSVAGLWAWQIRGAIIAEHQIVQAAALTLHLQFIEREPRRIAVLLVAGDKAGKWDSWYQDNIPIADELFDQHLTRLKEGGH